MADSQLFSVDEVISEVCEEENKENEVELTFEDAIKKAVAMFNPTTSLNFCKKMCLASLPSIVTVKSPCLY